MIEENRKYKKAQSVIEYALLIGISVAALITMQAYLKRGLQGHLKEEVTKLGTRKYTPELEGNQEHKARSFYKSTSLYTLDKDYLTVKSKSGIRGGDVKGVFEDEDQVDGGISESESGYTIPGTGITTTFREMYPSSGTDDESGSGNNTPTGSYNSPGNNMGPTEGSYAPPGGESGSYGSDAGGVDMGINPSSSGNDPTLGEMRDNILESRPSQNSADWSVDTP